MKSDDGHSQTLTVGLLPLYMDLFDDALPELRARVSRFVTTIMQELGKRGAEVLPAPLCARRAAIREAVAGFEKAGAGALVTLHVTYSPSLEAAPELARTGLPLIVLDTTPRFDFGRAQEMI